MTAKPTRKRHQRRIRFSVVLPVTVDLIVGTNDEEPGDESAWEILSVVSTNCEATPRLVSENIDDHDFEALAVAAANTKDLQ